MKIYPLKIRLAMRNVRRTLHRGGRDGTEASSQTCCSLDAWVEFGGCVLPLGLVLTCAIFTPCLHFRIAHSCTCCLCVQSKPWYCNSNSTLNQNKAISVFCHLPSCGKLVVLIGGERLSCLKPLTLHVSGFPDLTVYIRQGDKQVEHQVTSNSLTKAQ